MCRASLSAGGRFTSGQTAVTHVTFANDAEALGKLGHVVRAHQHAVAAADALIVEVPDDSRDRICFIGRNGAAVQAARVLAMVTCGCDRLGKWTGPTRADEHADVAPCLCIIEPVERVAGGDA